MAILQTIKKIAHSGDLGTIVEYEWPI